MKIFKIIVGVVTLMILVYFGYGFRSNDKIITTTTTNFVAVGTNFVKLTADVGLMLNPVETTTFLVSTDGTVGTEIPSDRLQDDPERKVKLEGITEIFLRLPESAGSRKIVFKVVKTTTNTK